LTSLGTGAAYALLMPLAAIVLLVPLEYGVFSAAYLVFALGISLQYSVVSEAWARRSLLQAEGPEWNPYSSVLIGLSTIVGCLLLILSAVLQTWVLELLVLAVGSAAGTFRSGSRYFMVAHSQFSRATLADAIGIIAFGLTFIASNSLSVFLQLAISWAIANIAASLILRRPSFFLRELHAWFAHRWRDIRPLVIDSLLLDISAIAVPYLLIGRLGLGDFGIYRAIASAAVPVRLIMDPLRPALGRVRPQEVLRIQSLALWVSIATSLGILVSVGLNLVGDVSALQGNTIAALKPYSVQAGLYTSFSLLTMVFYIVARTHANEKILISARLVQTLTAIAFPLFGAYFYGLPEAIWAYVWATLGGLVAWLVAVIVAASKEDEL
jgi:hypothetical protein